MLIVCFAEGISFRNFIYSGFIEKLHKEEKNIIFLVTNDKLKTELLNNGYKNIIKYNSTNALLVLQKKVFKFFRLFFLGNVRILDFYPDDSKPNNFFGANVVNRFSVKLLHCVYNLIQIFFTLLFIPFEFIKNKSFFSKTLTSNELVKFFLTTQRADELIVIDNLCKLFNKQTYTFVYSWDNVPKSINKYQSRHFFVWSSRMRLELLNFYDWTSDSKRVKVVGTPQFLSSDSSMENNKRDLILNEFNLPDDGKFVLFSGSDRNTSPYDFLYLDILCEEVEKLNNKNGQNRKIYVLFRKSPADSISRYQDVLIRHSNICYHIQENWKVANSWVDAFPLPGDSLILVKLLFLVDVVFNLGSTVFFDAILQGKPCFYLNFGVDIGNGEWSSSRLFRYPHFATIPSGFETLWIKDKSHFEVVLNKVSNQEWTREHMLHSFNWLKQICGMYGDDSQNEIISFLNGER